MEGLKHKKLKSEAIKLLKEKFNFKDNEIFEELRITLTKSNNRILKPDVVGKSFSRIVIVECGNISQLRIDAWIKEVGKDNFIHMPYEEHVLPPEYYLGNKEKKEKRNYLKAIYNKYLYEPLKEDGDFELQKFIEDKNQTFKVGGREIWMAFPTKKSANSGKDLINEINFTLSYINDNKFSLTVNAETNDAVKKFLDFTEQTQIKIIDEMKKLPSGFVFQIGFKYKDAHHVMPMARDWELYYPIPCKELSLDKLKEAGKVLQSYLDAGFGEYPVLSMVRVEANKEDLATALNLLKPIYQSSFSFRTYHQDNSEKDKLQELKNERGQAELEGNQEEYDRLCEEIYKLEEKIKNPFV